MKIKRFMALAAASMMALAGLSACGSSDSSSQTSNAGSEGTQQSSETAAPTGSDAPAETKPVKEFDNTIKPIKDISSWELIKDMKLGWNLGNTMDATGSSGLASEVAWQKNKTHKGMMDLLAKDGFNLLRVPVSWGEHMDADYKVDPEWMARVREIVDYGIDNGMYVILNTHHEEWYFPTEENKEQDKEQLKALWEQIAEEFKCYDEHLIFEGLNEPRLRGTNQEWTGSDSASKIINEYEKVFYDTVRASGGNNAKRHLMLTGYAASSSRNNLQKIDLPEGDDKIIVSVHAYIPYSFALDTKGTNKYPGNNDIKSFFSTLDSLFISKQIPVIVGEYGCMNKDNNTEERVKCVTDYLTAAKELGIPCVWWDNNSVIGNGENFGIMDRDLMGAAWRFPEIVNAMKQVYGIS